LIDSPKKPKRRKHFLQSNRKRQMTHWPVLPKQCNLLLKAKSKLKSLKSSYQLKREKSKVVRRK
jgi:hypothetical protein